MCSNASDYYLEKLYCRLKPTTALSQQAEANRANHVYAEDTQQTLNFSLKLLISLSKSWFFVRCKLLPRLQLRRCEVDSYAAEIWIGTLWLNAVNLLTRPWGTLKVNWRRLLKAGFFNWFGLLTKAFFEAFYKVWLNVLLQCDSPWAFLFRRC